MRKTLTSVFEFEELTEATVEAAWQADRGQLLGLLDLYFASYKPR